MGYPKTIERVGKTKKRNHEKDFLSGSFGSPGTDKCECTGKVQARSHDSLDRIELFARRCYRWGFTLPEYGAKVRLHLNEKMAVRLSLGLNTTTDKTTTFYDDANQKEQESYDRTTRTTFSIMPGFEYHFTKYERISPYVGGEIGLLASASKSKTDNTENDNYTETSRPGLGFGVNVFTGVDVYLCKGLYLGFELGLGYNSLNTKRGSTTTVTGSTTNEDKGTTADLVSSFGFHATPSLRVGWCF